MKTFDIVSIFGPLCCDSSLAVSFVHHNILPHIEQGKICLDFKDVVLVNESFINALFYTLFSVYGWKIINNLSIINANQLITSSIKWSIKFNKARTDTKIGQNINTTI